MLSSAAVTCGSVSVYAFVFHVVGCQLWNGRAVWATLRLF